MKPNAIKFEQIEISEAISNYFSEKSAIGAFSSRTIENRKYELNRFNSFCIANQIRKPEDIHKNLIISYLQAQNVSNASKLGILYVLTSFMDYLVEEGLIDENIAAFIRKPKIYPPKTDSLTFGELERVFLSESQNGTPKTAARNLLLLSLFTDVCLRVSEVIDLKQPDVRLDTGEIWITRKRGKVEKIPLNAGLIDRFRDWFVVRERYRGSRESDWVFLSSHGKRLTRRQVHNIVSNALKRAGIVKRKQGPHLLRHSGASLKARSGENLIMIQYLLGHENLNTTRRYLHFDWEELKGLVDRSPDFLRNSPETGNSFDKGKSL
jgi:site-specific recombinase XerD